MKKTNSISSTISGSGDQDLGQERSGSGIQDSTTLRAYTFDVVEHVKIMIVVYAGDEQAARKKAAESFKGKKVTIT